MCALEDALGLIHQLRRTGEIALYFVHESKQRGMLIVCRVHTGCDLALSLAGLGDGRGTARALVLEGVGLEPGFTKPVNRTIGANGALRLGPFGIALVS